MTENLYSQALNAVWPGLLPPTRHPPPMNTASKKTPARFCQAEPGRCAYQPPGVSRAGRQLAKLSSLNSMFDVGYPLKP